MNGDLIIRRMGSIAATLCSAVSIAGCSILTVPPAALVPTPVITPAFGGVSAIKKDNVEQIVELMQVEVGDATPIAAIGFTEAVTGVVVAYHSGALRHVSFPDGKVLASFNVAPISVGATVFDKSGRLLATVAGDAPNAEAAGYSSNLDGVRVWDVNTGTLNPRWTITVTGHDRDVALNADGDSLLEAGRSGGFSILDGTTRRYAVNMALMNQESPEGPFRGFDAATFDEQGQYIALADQNGLVVIRRVLPNDAEAVVSISTPGARYDWYAHRDSLWKPTAIAFDPSRRWLALVASGQLLVYRLQPVTNHLHVTISSPSDPSAALAYDPSGELLAVGTASGWQIWDVANKKLLSENKAAPVYAMTFSPDGRLFAVGDANGVMHVWGIPDK